MRFCYVALAVPFVMLAGEASAAEIYNQNGNRLDLYGLVSGLHYMTDDKSQDGDQSYMRIGFKGQTQISDRLTGYGQWQSQFNASQSEGENDSMFTRLAFAGVKVGEFGSFDYGRNVGVLYDALSQTDMQPEFDAQTYNTDQFMFRRGNSLATYRNTDFFGLVDDLNFALQYQAKNDGGGEPGARDVLRQNGDGYGMSISYAFDNGIKAVGAFTHSDRTNEQNNASGIMGRGDHAEAYSASLKYAFAQYTFDSGWVPFIAYNQLRAKDLGRAGDGTVYGKQDLVKFVDFGTTYNFNRNMLAYVDYKINRVEKNTFTKAAGISTDDIVALGLVYQF